MGKSVLKKHLKYIVPEVRLALIKEPGKPIAIVGPQDIARFVEPLRYRSEEHFVAFFLDANNQVTGYCDVSHGTVSAFIPS